MLNEEKWSLKASKSQHNSTSSRASDNFFLIDDQASIHELGLGTEAAVLSGIGLH
jgi:hypothetical protein